MIELLPAGDVTQVRLTTAWSRAAGYSVSVYLARGVMIDTGFPDVARDVAALIAERRPAGVVLTHWHEDHAGNLELAARRGLPVAATPMTLELLRAGEDAAAYRRVVWGAMRPLRAPVAPFEPAGLALVPTPGHSPDHHAVWDAERETLFAGDLFLGVKVRVARPGEDPRALVGSLRRAAALRPRLMFDAHRGRVDDPVAALTAKADWIEATIAAIEDRAARGWSDRAIARDVLGAEELVSYVALGEMSRLNFVRMVRATGDG